MESTSKHIFILGICCIIGIVVLLINAFRDEIGHDSACIKEAKAVYDTCKDKYYWMETGFIASLGNHINSYEKNIFGESGFESANHHMAVLFGKYNRYEDYFAEIERINGMSFPERIGRRLNLQKQIESKLAGTYQGAVLSGCNAVMACIDYMEISRDLSCKDFRIDFTGKLIELNVKVVNNVILNLPMMRIGNMAKIKYRFKNPEKYIFSEESEKIKNLQRHYDKRVEKILNSRKGN